MYWPTRIAVLLLPVLLGACQWGTRPTGFKPALSPDGALVAVRVRGEPADRKGELYAVDSIGVIMRLAQLTRISWAQLSAMDVSHVGADYDVLKGERVSPEKRARLSLLSRFPQGLSGDLLAQVLKKLDQTSLREVP
jgi:hypothetical protein